ncbi:class I SAM-dependent methyltransferase [Rhizobiaceae bacterium]|nr:class I SAM-dependent methyltransferase [Rhizobiaceae bacterium]
MTASRHSKAARALALHQNGGGHDFLLDLAVNDMVERMGAVTRTFARGLALFGRTDALASAMRASGQVEEVVRVEEAVHAGRADAVAPAADDLQLEANAFDVALVPFALHGAADLPGALIQLHRALRPDGLLLAVLPGPSTLHELRTSLLEAEAEAGGAGQRVDALTDLRDAGALLQRTGFALPVVDRDVVTVRYGALSGLIADLRGMGATRAGGAPLSRLVWARAQAIYAERFADPDGRLRATFELVSMQAWVPHESQQKPARPGSAKTRLADALGTVEKPLKR